MNSRIQCMLIILFGVTHTVSFAASDIQKTANDVYHEALILEENVRLLRKKADVKSDWPNIEVKTGHQPRHVLQKAIEILDKINRYRKNIVKTGEIPVTHFVGRNITPNEVFLAVSRLRQEVLILHPTSRTKYKSEATYTNKSSNDVYAKLSEISAALDESLGLRGITPSEVFSRSQQVVDLARFLRQSQNLSMRVNEPQRTSRQLPNHALQSVHRLLKKVSTAEKNLWMKPIVVTEVPKRVISPGDVYDAMGVLLAELERIQYRLGLERYFPKPNAISGKTPDDVIYNTEMAALLLPEFSIDKPLQQYEKTSLVKDSNHVFSVTEHILGQLKKYKRQKGIKVKIKKVPLVSGVKPQHVYSKTLEVLDKINLYRIKISSGASVVPNYPLRKITPQEVFDLSLLVDDNLLKIYQNAGIKSSSWLIISTPKEYTDKTPSDVYNNVWKISNVLDSLLGLQSFTPNETFQKARELSDEIDIVYKALNGEKVSVVRNKKKRIEDRVEPKDVFRKSEKILGLILKAQRRAGMFDVDYISVPTEGVINPSDVYNQVRLIEAELTELKVFLGISKRAEKAPSVEGKQPLDVFNILNDVEVKLEMLMQLRGRS